MAGRVRLVWHNSKPRQRERSVLQLRRYALCQVIIVGNLLSTDAAKFGQPCAQLTQSLAVWSLSGLPACRSLAKSATALRAALPPAL